jgi:broad specificity phosphatase PhoE
MTARPWLAEPSNDTKRIIFARHGEYICNVLKLSNGNPRIGYNLTERGQVQARELGLRLANHGIEAVVTSEYLRARETAALVNETLRLPQLVNRLANEIAVGPALEGKPHALFQDAVGADPVNLPTGEGGESYAQMKRRIVLLIDDLVLSSPKTTLVVTHGWTLQIVRSLVGQINDLDAANCVDMPTNCEFIEVLVSANGVMRLAETLTS